jgi:hypothetical protein
MQLTGKLKVLQRGWGGRETKGRGITIGQDRNMEEQKQDKERKKGSKGSILP